MLDLARQPRPAWAATSFRAIELVGAQFAVPGQYGVGLSHSCDLGESRAAEPMPDFTKREALGIRELQASIQLGFQNAVLGGQIFTSQQFLVRRPSDVGQHAAQSIRPLGPTYGIIEIPSWQQITERF